MNYTIKDIDCGEEYRHCGVHRWIGGDTYHCNLLVQGQKIKLPDSKATRVDTLDHRRNFASRAKNTNTDGD